VGKVADDLRGGMRELFDTPSRTTAPNGAGPARPETPRAPDPPKLGDPEKAAQIFGRESCPWTGRSIALLEREGAGFEFVDLAAPQNGMLASWLVAQTKQHTEPYVFLRGRFIGGYNALDEIVRLGQLSQEIMSATERARKPSRIRIEVAPRDDNNRPPPGEVQE
jgi:glutaredoxin